MVEATSALEEAIAEVDHLRRILRKRRAPQVRSTDERSLAKATASAWFRSHRPRVASVLTDLHLVDEAYQMVLENSDRHGARSKYISTLGKLRSELIRFRTETLRGGHPRATSSDEPPDFSPLIADAAMQQILVSRWDECLRCMGAGAALAATVMMGGLLEALLLARINREKDKSAIFKAKAAPKNAKTGMVKPLGEWMLNDFLQVLAEIKWITVSATAVGAILRDYRNYIHPQKQLSHNVHLEAADASLFWEVSKNITRQVVAS